MTHDEQIELISDVPDEHKEILLKVFKSYDEALREQLYAEHGDAWRARYGSIAPQAIKAFKQKLMARL